MRKFPYAPDSTGYALNDAEESVMVELAGGSPRVRRDIMNGAMALNCSWTFDQDKYEYMRKFYRVVMDKDGGKFLCDLIVDSALLTEHECVFVPGSMKLSSQSGHTFVVGATIKVVPIPMDTDYEEYLLDLIDIYGSQKELYIVLNLLDHLANVELPKI